MKIRSLAFLLALALVASPLTRAQETPAPAQAGAPSGGKEKKTELEGEMGKIGKAYRKLKKQLSDSSQNESSLELLATMQAAAKEAVDKTPAKAADIPEDQRAKFVADYQQGMKDLLAAFSRLEEALKAGKNDEAVSIAKEIDDVEKKGHKEFRRKKKD